LFFPKIFGNELCKIMLQAQHIIHGSSPQSGKNPVIALARKRTKGAQDGRKGF
jgi:hypothetical protein